MFRVVVLGGTGNFGARIVRALAEDPLIELVAAGRRAAPVPGAPDVPTGVLDIAAPDFAVKLEALTPQLVIHCVGPFQQQDYRVAQATLAAGAHYLDLADGRDFVAGFAAAMDANAKSSGRMALSGASTLPALSTAVLDSLCVGLTSPDSIQIVIAPGQRATRGAATLAAVLSYLGRPISIWRGGKWQTGWGWMDLKRFDLGFASRRGALCDVPDLALLPARYPQVQSVTFHAALEVGAQSLMLWMLAALRRLGIPLPVEKWSRLLDRMAGLFDGLAGEWGGMQVQVAGLNEGGRRVQRSWTLKVPANNGPEIPCLAAILLARRIARGESFASGAFPCMGYLTLGEFEGLFGRWDITTIRGEVDVSP